MIFKQDSSLESAIETANGYKTYYRDYDRMGMRNKIFTLIIFINLILSILAMILAIGIPFTGTVHRDTENIIQENPKFTDTENILIMVHNLEKIMEKNSEGITKNSEGILKLNRDLHDRDDD